MIGVLRCEASNENAHLKLLILKSQLYLEKRLQIFVKEIKKLVLENHEKGKKY